MLRPAGIAGSRLVELRGIEPLTSAVRLQRLDAVPERKPKVISPILAPKPSKSSDLRYAAIQHDTVSYPISLPWSQRLQDAAVGDGPLAALTDDVRQLSL